MEKAETEFRRAVEQSPSNVEYVDTLARILAREQKFQEAIGWFQKAVKLDPTDLKLRRDLATAQWQAGKLEAARDNLESILKATPKDEQVTLLLGMVYAELKDYIRAAKLLDSVEPLVRQHPESIVALAQSYYGIGRKDKACELLNSLKSHPAGPQVVFLGGQVATDAADYETAEELFTSIKSTFPDHATLGYKLASVQFRANRVEASQRTLLDLISAGDQNSEVYELLGWCYHKQGQIEEAVRAFEKAIELEPAQEGNYLGLGTIFLEQRQFRPARSVAEDLLARHPDSCNGYLLKGMAQLQLGEFTDAVESYGRALQLDPTAPEAHVGLASAQWSAGMTAAATNTFDENLKRFPRDANNCQEYGRFLLKQAETGDRTAEARAIALLDKAIGLNGSLPESHFLLGNLLLTKEEIPQALPHLERAVQLDPQASRYRLALARAYRRAHRNDDAARELQAFQSLKAAEEKLAAATTLPQSGRN
jgi:tetratricopeptide (TPR) repeat protein